MDKTLRRTGRLNMASMWFINDRKAEQGFNVVYK